MDIGRGKGFFEVCEQENALIPFLLAIFTGMRREKFSLKMEKCRWTKGLYT